MSVSRRDQLADADILRFEKFVGRSEKNDCWLWAGAVQNSGYGHFGGGHCNLHGTAHRIAYVIAYGDIPDGHYVLHRCDVKRCVNPAHLWTGTHRENMDDMRAKGRAHLGDEHGLRKHPECAVRGSRHHRAKLTEYDIPIIRARIAAGDSQSAIGRDYGVNQSQIASIKRGATWRHVPLDSLQLGLELPS